MLLKAGGIVVCVIGLVSFGLAYLDWRFYLAAWFRGLEPRNEHPLFEQFVRASSAGFLLVVSGLALVLFPSVWSAGLTFGLSIIALFVGDVLDFKYLTPILKQRGDVRKHIAYVPMRRCYLIFIVGMVESVVLFISTIGAGGR